MSTVTEILSNVDAEIKEVLDQKHLCEGLYAEIMVNKKKLEALAEEYNKQLTIYKKLLKK